MARAFEEVHVEIEITAPTERVWSVISDYAHPHRYLSGVCDAKLVDERERGVGAARTCDLPPVLWMRQYVVEEVDEWIEGRSFAFVIKDTSAPIDEGRARWRVIPTVAGTRLTVDVRYRPSPLGWVMRRSLATAFRQQLETALAEIKEFVERPAWAA